MNAISLPPTVVQSLHTIAYEIAAKDAAWPVLPILMARLQDTEIVYVTTALANTFGYEIEELIGESVGSLLPEDIRETHALWMRDVSVPKTRLMGAGRQVQGRRKSGELFPAHVGLTQVTVLDEAIGIAFVVDLTGVLRTLDPNNSWATPREWPAKPTVEDKSSVAG